MLGLPFPAEIIYFAGLNTPYRHHRLYMRFPAHFYLVGFVHLSAFIGVYIPAGKISHYLLFAREEPEQT